MKNDLRLSIARDFSETPGPRLIAEGDYSGQEFRENFLQPMFEQAVKLNVALLVDLDGVEGYATSFLEEAFGGLARSYGRDLVEKHIQLKSNDVKAFADEVWEYVREANKA